eukprot:Unigene11673_Nuclearia_a/m.35562 Unigene11673_Nuclearia_a/g.35562  ORF Unigene11673_Nuclearia_a/g.35562 Unigene11673_Nuclearia_a/m.35562 type:complete len:351 (+) Unigene11673_Nuclearia_a:1685-2737(+)
MRRARLSSVSASHLACASLAITAGAQLASVWHRCASDVWICTSTPALRCGAAFRRNVSLRRRMCGATTSANTSDSATSAARCSSTRAISSGGCTSVANSCSSSCVTMLSTMSAKTWCLSDASGSVSKSRKTAAGSLVATRTNARARRAISSRTAAGRLSRLRVASAPRRPTLPGTPRNISSRCFMASSRTESSSSASSDIVSCAQNTYRSASSGYCRARSRSTAAAFLRTDTASSRTRISIVSRSCRAALTLPSISLAIVSNARRRTDAWRSPRPFLTASRTTGSSSTRGSSLARSCTTFIAETRTLTLSSFKLRTTNANTSVYCTNSCCWRAMSTTIASRASTGICATL